MHVEMVGSKSANSRFFYVDVYDVLRINDAMKVTEH